MPWERSREALRGQNEKLSFKTYYIFEWDAKHNSKLPRAQGSDKVTLTANSILTYLCYPHFLKQGLWTQVKNTDFYAISLVQSCLGSFVVHSSWLMAGAPSLFLVKARSSWSQPTSDELWWAVSWPHPAVSSAAVICWVELAPCNKRRFLSFWNKLFLSDVTFQSLTDKSFEMFLWVPYMSPGIRPKSS